MDHAEAKSLIGLYFDRSQELKREVTVKMQDLSSFKALGLIAQIKDKDTHSIVTLAYEPYMIA
jgi:hypothetical protein